jgi:hypothetical protein
VRRERAERPIEEPQPSSGGSGGRGDLSSNSLEDINDAIARTQQFLTNRGVKANPAAAAPAPAPLTHRSQDSVSRSGRSSELSMEGYLGPHQARQAAALSYGDRQEEHDDEDSSSYHSLRLSAPSLLPATPPLMSSELSLSYGEGDMEAEHDSEAEDGHDDQHRYPPLPLGTEDGEGTEEWDSYQQKMREKSYSAPLLSSQGSSDQYSLSGQQQQQIRGERDKENTATKPRKSNRKVKSSSSRARSSGDKEQPPPDKEPGLFPKIPLSRKPLGGR